jgi:tetratricopeptide (TPR) repeat protein
VTETASRYPIPQRLALALQHQSAGRLAAAESLCQSILQEAPEHPGALQLMAMLAHKAGRQQVAIDLLYRAMAVTGPNALCHCNLAAAYLAADQLRETEAHSREAIRLQPNYADAQYHLALALSGQDRLDEAEAAFRAVFALRPGDVDARSNLASVLRRQGRLAEAVTLLEEAIRLSPNNARAHNGLGAVLLDMDQPAAAERHLRESLRLSPDVAQTYGNLGLALRDQDRLEEAALSFQEALRLKPGYQRALINLALARESQGKADAALGQFLEILRQDPHSGWGWGGLSRLAAVGRYTFREDEVRWVESLAARPGLPSDEASRLHFALARIRERAGDYDQAFAHFRQASAALRQTLPATAEAAFDPVSRTARVTQIIEYFSPAYFEHVRTFGVDSDVPVFVVGMPRSGTSLVEQILASHPQAHGAGELRDIGQIVSQLPERLGGNDLYPNCLDQLDRPTTQALAEPYLARLRQLGGGALRVVDKMPFNFQYLGLIATLFPRARIVHCRRDPVDTCLSCFVQEFARPMPCGPDLEQIGRYYREYDRLMTHYAQVLPLPMLELQYEELTADQEAVSRRLVEFCGLPWDERCLRFHETDRPVRTCSALQVREPMYRSSVGRWKRYEKHLGTLLEVLGR